MSHLASELETLLKEKGMRATDLARASGLTQASVSRIRSGGQIWVKASDLEKIAAAIDKSPMIHARLLRAHLLDECSGPGKELIEIELTGRRRRSIHEEAPPYGIKLPPKEEQAMRIISEHVTQDPELRKIILSLASLYAKGTLSD